MDIVIESPGISLQVENENFAIVSHDGKKLIPTDDVDTIKIGKDARISSNAVLLALKNEIEILFNNEMGVTQGRVEKGRMNSVVANRRNQLKFFYSKKSVDWVKQLVAYKMKSQSALLLLLENEDEEAILIARRSVNAIADQKNKILGLDGEMITDIAISLRGWEAVASRRYNEAVYAYLPKWYRFENDQTEEMAPFSALLNYGYGVLHGKVEDALMKAGLAPYIGGFHRDAQNRPALIYDVMERYKVWVDYVAVDLCRQEALKEECFTTNKGAVWLTTLGRRIFIQALKDYFGEVIRINQIDSHRVSHITHYTRSLPKVFSDF